MHPSWSTRLYHSKSLPNRSAYTQLKDFFKVEDQGSHGVMLWHSKDLYLFNLLTPDKLIIFTSCRCLLLNEGCHLGLIAWLIDSSTWSIYLVSPSFLPLPTLLFSSILYHPLPFLSSLYQRYTILSRKILLWLYHLLDLTASSLFSFPALSCWIIALATSLLLHYLKSCLCSALGIHTLGPFCVVS